SGALVQHRTILKCPWPRNSAPRRDFGRNPLHTIEVAVVRLQRQCADPPRVTGGTKSQLKVKCTVTAISSIGGMSRARHLRRIVEDHNGRLIKCLPNLHHLRILTLQSPKMARRSAIAN